MRLGGGAVLGDRAADIAGHLQQVGARRVQAMVVLQALVELASRASPASGPSTIAAAIARFSATIGLPVIRSSSP